MYTIHFNSFLYQIESFFEWVHSRVPKYYSIFPLRVLANSNTYFDLQELNTSSKFENNEAKNKVNHIQNNLFDSLKSILISSIIKAYAQIYPELKIIFVNSSNDLFPLDQMFEKKINYFSKFFLEADKLCANKRNEIISCNNIYSNNLYLYIKKYHFNFIKNYNISRKNINNKFLNIEKVETNTQFRTKLSYYKIGKGMPIILLTPLGLSHIVWKKLIYYLADSYRVITWDLQGLYNQINNNNSIKTYTINEHCNDLNVILNNERIDKFHLVAWSDSTHIALSYYRMFPEKIRSLILMSGLYTNFIKHHTSYIKQMDQMAKSINSNEKLASIFLKIIKGYRNNRINLKTYKENSNILENLPDIGDGDFILFHSNEMTLINYFRMLDSIDMEKINNIAMSIDVKTLIIYGDHDQLVNPSQSEWLAKRINCKTISIPGGSHYIPSEINGNIADDITNFIEAI
jgi:pimeloyl-ACP methyl ester carboxylesterase